MFQILPPGHVRLRNYNWREDSLNPMIEIAKILGKSKPAHSDLAMEINITMNFAEQLKNVSDEFSLSIKYSFHEKI